MSENKATLQGLNSVVDGTPPINGTDAEVWAILSTTPGHFIDRNLIHLGTLKAISISTFRDKNPVRSLGAVYPRGFVRGQRTVAGTMVFVTIRQSAFREIISSYAKGKARSSELSEGELVQGLEILNDKVNSLRRTLFGGYLPTIRSITRDSYETKWAVDPSSAPRTTKERETFIANKVDEQLRKDYPKEFAELEKFEKEYEARLAFYDDYDNKMSAFENGVKDSFPFAITDQLPPIDLFIQFNNESFASSNMAVYGVEMFSNGMSISIDNIQIEEVIKYKALGLAELEYTGQGNFSPTKGSEVSTVNFDNSALELFQTRSPGNGASARRIANNYIKEQNPFF